MNVLEERRRCFDERRKLLRWIEMASKIPTARIVARIARRKLAKVGVRYAELADAE